MDTLIKSILIFFVSILSFSGGIFLGKGITESEYKQVALKCEYEKLKETKKNLMEDSEFLENETFHAHRDSAKKNMNEEVSELSNKFIQEERAEQNHMKDPNKSLTKKHVSDKKSLSNEKSHSKQEVHLTENTKEEQDSSFSKIHQGYKLLSSGKKSKESKKNSVSSEQKNKYYNILSQWKKLPKQEKEKQKKKKSEKTHLTEDSKHNNTSKHQRGMASLGTFASKQVKKAPFSHEPSLSRYVSISEKKKRSWSKYTLDNMKNFPHRTRYTIQVASYKNEKDAENHVSSLKSKGYGAFYLKTMIKNQFWYRVSVGVFPIRKSALEFQEELEKEAGIKASFIQKISN